MRKLPVATLALAALLLSGCVPEPTTVTHPPTPSATPVFASEEEALAAAEDAYAAYLKMSDQVTAEGGENPVEMKPYLSDDLYEKLLGTFAALKQKQWRTSGSTTYRDMQLASLDDYGAPAFLDLYLCVDVTNVKIIDANGSDVTPLRENVVALEISYRAENRSKLVLESSGSWSGTGLC